MENNHKRLCAVYGSCAVDRSSVGRWVQGVKASESGETGLHDRPWSGSPATATTPDMLQRANDIIHSDWRITSRQLAIQSLQSAMEVHWQLLTLWDIRRCVQDGFLEVSRPSTDVKGKPSVLNCWSVLMLRGRPFCPGSLQMMKPGLTIMSRRRKGNQRSASSAITKKKEVQDNSFRQKAHDHRLLGH